LKSPPLSAFDLVEGLQLGHAVAALQSLGIFASLERARPLASLARRHRVDAGLLRGVLHYVLARTVLLRRRGRDFMVTPAYTRQAPFLLELYAGAFRDNAVHLAEVLRHPRQAAARVDRTRHARAFTTAPATVGVLPAIIRQLGFERVLDLGCGAGTLLVELARRDPQVRGWGVDENLALCRAARARIRAEHLPRRLAIFHGSVERLGTSVPRGIVEQIIALIAAQVANEFFASGNTRVIAWLRALRRRFPGRWLVLADYYGRLGTAIATGQRETLLHDYVQLISGQGIPPASAAEWRGLYRAAGVRLAHVIEDRTTTLFVHVVRL
jgi:SAM-dependent methyltransferase